MKNKSIDVLFTGLVRTPEIVKKSMKDLLDLRKKGVINKIILSTWIGEIQKYPELVDMFNKNKIVLIENEEPKNPGRGSIWCQMKAMEEGLKIIDPNRFVFKSRLDAYINPKFLEKLQESPDLFKITHNLPKGNIFKYKVWVPWYELTVPFYLADECFFGLCEDLKHLINYETKYDTDYNMCHGPTHVRRFINPFLNDYPILYQSLDKYNKESKFKTLARKFSRQVFDLERFKTIKTLYKRNKFYLLKKRKKDNNYIECLAVYYSILHSHFYIDGDSFQDQLVFKEQSSPMPIDDNSIDNNFNEKKERLPYGGRIYGYNQKLLDNIFNKKITETTTFSKKLIEAIDKFNNSTFN